MTTAQKNSTSVIAWGQYVLPSNVFQPPGNSLRLIDAAFACGYDGVELDVQMSKDGELVLMHDHTLDRTTQANGLVSERTVEELAKIELKDPWSGAPCYVETLASGLVRVGCKGWVMIDMHHATRKSVAAVARSVAASAFDRTRLILLTYTEEGGLIYKDFFPEATVLLKAPFNFVPPKLDLSFLAKGEKLDGALLPLCEFPDELSQFRQEMRSKAKKLATFMHKTGVDDLVRLMDLGVDFVTSYSPLGIGEAKRRCALPIVSTESGADWLRRDQTWVRG